MRERLLITTAIGLMLGAGAYAQSPSEQPRNSSPPGGAKSEQSEFFVSAVGVLFDTVFAEFDAVCPEHPVSAFRDITTANDDEPIGPGHGQQ
jgi:hypothetical protein